MSNRSHIERQKVAAHNRRFDMEKEDKAVMVRVKERAKEIVRQAVAMGSR